MPNHSNKTDPTTVIEKITTPLQLVSLLIICISVYWLSSIKNLNSRQAIIIFCVISLLVFAIIILHYANRIRGQSFVFLIILIYITIVSLIGWALYGSAAYISPAQKPYYIVDLRDTADRVPSDILDIEFSVLQDGMPIQVISFSPQGRSTFMLNNFEVSDSFRLEIKHENYQFMNGQNYLVIRPWKNDTLLKIQRRVSLKPRPIRNYPSTFNLLPKDPDIIKRIKKTCPDLVYTESANAMYKIVLNFNPEAIKFLSQSETYELVRTPILATVNSRCSLEIGNFTPSSRYSRKDIVENLAKRQLRECALNFNYHNIKDCQ